MLHYREALAFIYNEKFKYTYTIIHKCSKIYYETNIEILSALNMSMDPRLRMF